MDLTGGSQIMAVPGTDWTRPGARAPRADRHPWLAGLGWLVEAGERLNAALDPDDVIDVAIDTQRDRPATAGVRILTSRTPDELDDMPGIRRIERRATEIAAHVPAPQPFGARLRMTRDDIALHIMWHMPGEAVLLSHRRGDGWHGADMLIIPSRYIHVTDSDLLVRSRDMLASIDRLYGGGRIDPHAEIHSAYRRDDQICALISAGAILNTGSSEVA